MRLLSNAVLTAARSGSRRIGDAQAPADQTLPYAVVYPLYISDQDGDLWNPTADGWYEYQVTSVGATRQQAQGLADELEATLLGSTYTVTGFRCHPIIRQDVLPIERDDTTQPPVFYQSVMYRIFVTPSP